MKQSPLLRKTPLQSHSELKRSPMKRRAPGKAARRRMFTKEEVAYVTERSGGICEWCRQRRATQTHHCKFRSQLSRSEGSGGKVNALRICDECDALVHGGKEGQKYRVLFAKRAQELAEVQPVHA